MRALSPRERRLTAVALLFALLAAVQLLVVSPIVGGFATRADQRQALLLRYEHNARSIVAIPSTRRQAERQRAVLTRFVLGAPGVDGGRELLKERLQRAIEAVGGEFRASEEANAPPGWVRARAEARLSLPQLAALLAMLQNQPPYLVVDTLGVTAEDALVTNQASAMDVRIEAAIPLRPAAPR